MQRRDLLSIGGIAAMAGVSERPRKQPPSQVVVGKGHITRILTPVSNIFIRVADGFDVVAWSRGEA